VFNAISAEGLGNAQVLSSGISEALVTTVTGLIIGIPALALYSYLAKRVESLANELHEIGTSFVARIAETTPRGRIEPFEGRDSQSAGGPR
jgi:biopolymer transport protein ExbB